MATNDPQPARIFSVLGRWRGPALWAPAVAVVVALVFAYWWWFVRVPPLHYVTARVTRGDIQRTVSMTGALNPVVTAQVGSYVSGNIKSWSCDYNTLVKVGQICALIDPLPFQVIVDQDEADVHSASDRHAVEIASEALKLQQASYAVGKTNVLQLIDAQRTYAQARLGLASAQVQQLQDTAGLVVALGGGWWKDPQAPAAQ